MLKAKDIILFNYCEKKVMQYNKHEFMTGIKQILFCLHCKNKKLIKLWQA